MYQSVLVVAVGLLACCSSAARVPFATRPELDRKSTSTAVRAGHRDPTDIASLTPVTLAHLSAGHVIVRSSSSGGGGSGREEVALPPWVRTKKAPRETGRIGPDFHAWYAFGVAYIFNNK
ncbi:unnamed protein product, partial [Ascophyllum nodosum]